MYQPEKLKGRRKELKLTQKDIADKLGISYQAYSAWERGVKKPSTEKVALLEKLLNVPKGYFTEIEIVRLYSILSPNGKEQVVSYARDLVAEEQNKKVISIAEPRYEYRVYEEMSAGLGTTIYGEKEMKCVKESAKLFQQMHPNCTLYEAKGYNHGYLSTYLPLEWMELVTPFLERNE